YCDAYEALYDLAAAGRIFGDCPLNKGSSPTQMHLRTTRWSVPTWRALGSQCFPRTERGRSYRAARGFARTVGEACEVAAKSSETDATKRALATLGHPLGRALYDAQHRRVQALPQRNGEKALDEGFDAPP